MKSVTILPEDGEEVRFADDLELSLTLSDNFFDERVDRVEPSRSRDLDDHVGHMALTLGAAGR